jgi:hypothetical protein
MKVLVNDCYGGFGISLEAELLYLKKKEISYELLEENFGKGKYLINGEENYLHLSRTDEVLIEVVEEIGSERASGIHAELSIAEIPDGADYSIHEYDGTEYIDSTWFTFTAEELKKGLSDEQLELATQVSCIKIEY